MNTDFLPDVHSGDEIYLWSSNDGYIYECLDNYLWPTIILQDSKAITMPMLVANLKSGYSVDYGMLMLGVLVCTLPTAIIFLCLQKSFAMELREQ